MSTENIDGIEEARRLAESVANSSRQQRQQLAEEAAAIVSARRNDNENFEIAKRASEQRHNDELAEIGEELGQLDNIVGTAPAQPEGQPTNEQPQPASNPTPANPPTPSEDSTPAAPPIAVLPVDDPEPQEDLGLQRAQEVPSRFDPRGWNWRRWWWVIALLTFAGVVIASILWGAFAQDLYFSVSPQWLTMAFILSFTHWIVWPAVGFFLGGRISHHLEDRRQARINQRNNPPAPPVAAPAA